MINNKQKGIYFLLLSAFSFSLMNVFVRLSGDIPSIQKAFFRNLIAGIVIVITIIKDNDSKLEKKHIPLLLVRALTGTLALICNFYSVDHLILSDATILMKIAPFSTLLFSIFILKEKPKFIQIIFVIIAFAGAAFVANPAFSGDNPLDYIIALSGGVGAGLAYTFVRKLTTQGCDKKIIIAFFSIFSCLFTLPFTLLNFTPMTMKQLMFLILAGISATGGQIGVTYAYSYAPAKEISLFDYSQIIYAALFSFFIFTEVPSFKAIIGYFLIVLAGCLVFIYNKRQQKLI